MSLNLPPVPQQTPINDKSGMPSFPWANWFENLRALVLSLSSGGGGGVTTIAGGGTNSSTSLNNNRVMVSSSGKIVEASAITANKAIISDSNGLPTQSATTSTEIGFVSGVTSEIQTQIDGKMALFPTIVAEITGAAANASTTSVIIFPTVTNDTASAYNATTGQYITTVDGYFEIQFSFRAGSGAAIPIYVYFGGVQGPCIGCISSIDGTASGGGTFHVATATTIDIRPVGGTVAGMASDSSYSIYKLP